MPSTPLVKPFVPKELLMQLSRFRAFLHSQKILRTFLEHSQKKVSFKMKKRIASSSRALPTILWGGIVLCVQHSSVREEQFPCQALSVATGRGESREDLTSSNINGTMKGEERSFSLLSL